MSTIPSRAQNRPNAIRKEKKGSNKSALRTTSKVNFASPMKLKSGKKIAKVQINSSIKTTRKNKQDCTIDWEVASTSAASSASTTASVITSK